MRPGAHAMAASRQSAAEDEDDDLREDEDEDLEDLEGVRVGVEAELPCETFTSPKACSPCGSGMRSRFERSSALRVWMARMYCTPPSSALGTPRLSDQRHRASGHLGRGKALV